MSGETEPKHFDSFWNGMYVGVSCVMKKKMQPFAEAIAQCGVVRIMPHRASAASFDTKVLLCQLWSIFHFQVGFNNPKVP
jgi:hypothetical protein